MKENRYVLKKLPLNFLKKRLKLYCLLGMLAMLSFQWVGTAQGAGFESLGDLPGGDIASTAADISADGKTIVGGSKSTNSGTTWEAFKWTKETGLVGLGDVPGGIFFSFGNAVSADGQVVVGNSSYNVSGTGENNHAFRWTSGSGIIDLGDLPGGANYSSANGVSDDGTSIIGGSSATDGNSTFRWRSGTGMVELPGIGGRDASFDGSVVIGENSGGPGFRWTQGTGAVTIGSLNGPSGQSEPLKITPDGLIIVGQSSSPSGPQAFRWTSGVGMIGLGDLPGGIFSSRALDVSADGSVVVGYSDTGSGNEAFIWDSVNGMQRLADVLAVGGVDLTGWTLIDATGISDDGLIVVGTGTNPSGNTEAFKASLPLTLSAPDTVVTYNGTVEVPLVLDAAQQNIVAVEVQVVYDRTVVMPGSPNATSITGTLVELGWSVEDNVLPGSGVYDTLSIAMSTALDTINQGGDLIKLVMVAKDHRSPASTPLELFYVLFNDGTPIADKVDGSITIIGTDGTVSASPDSIYPGNVVNITVTDTDFDLDVGTPDQVSATAISKLYNDSQTVLLSETGANTGIFTGSVNTAFALAAGTSEDGVITTIAGDSICVSFVDSLTLLGTTVTRYDTVEVVGGADGEVLASFVVQSLNGRGGVRDTVRVQVTDSDLDIDVGLAEQVSATITNNVSGEIETVTLIETGISTGIFQLRVPTIEGVSGTNNNGELSLASEDTLSVSYVDALTAQGGVLPRTDVTQVVNLFGDVRSNDQVQAFDAASVLAQAVGLNIYTARDSLLGDVDGNGNVASFDASLVLQYVVRLIDRFPVQTDDSLNPPDDEKNHPFLKPVFLNPLVALGDPQLQGDGTYLLPVTLTDREGVLSATLDIGHNEHIQILDVMTDAAYGGFMVAHHAEKERVRIAFAGATSQVMGSGNVLYLHIKAQNDLQFSLDHILINGQALSGTGPLNVIAQETSAIQVYALHQNKPNPFNPDTTIRYDLPEASDVKIVIYNVMGQKVQTLISKYQESGTHHIVWHAQNALGLDVSSGVYFLRMEANDYIETRKMLLLK